MPYAIEPAGEIHRLGHVEFLKGEPVASFQVGQIARGSRNEIVEGDDFMPFGEEPVTEVGSDKPRRAGD